MRQPPRYRILALLIAAAGVALVVVAVFTGDTAESRDVAGIRAAGASARRGENGRDGRRARVSTLPKNYACPQCGSRIGWGNQACPRCRWRPGALMEEAAFNANTFAGPLAPPRAPHGAVKSAPASPAWAGVRLNAGRPGANHSRAASPALPSPRQQNAAGKEFIEGHWLGLEVVPLIPELAKEYGVPKGETGVLVDEVTLEAAESGILAGDVVRSVAGRPAPDLKAFFLATQRVREQGRARVGISRRGSKMTFVIEARNARELGLAQMEAAQPILPGSISPHRSRGRPCTDCHIIMRTGGQLPTDAGDILPNPPPITRGARAPHGNRGRCSTCHVIR